MRSGVKNMVDNFGVQAGVKNIAYNISVVCLMVFNSIFNNIPVISWQSVLLSKETGVHNVVLSTPRLSGIRTHNISGDRY